MPVIAALRGREDAFGRSAFGRFGSPVFREGDPGFRGERRCRRFVGRVAVTSDTHTGSRQRFALRQLVGRAAGLQLAQQLHDAAAALDRIIEPDAELGDAPEAKPAAELMTDERHRPFKRSDRREAVLVRPDHADPDASMAKVRRRFDVGDRGEPDARVGDFSRQERRDLLPQQLVDSLGSLGHLAGSGVAARR